MSRLRVVLAILLAAAALAASAATAAAITVSPGGSNTATGFLTFISPRIVMRCDASLGESITAGTYAPGNAFGTLNSATLTRCVPPGVTITQLSAPIAIGDLTTGGLMRKSVPIGVLAVIAGSSCLWRGDLIFQTDGTTLRVDPATLLVQDPLQPLVSLSCPALRDLRVQGTLTRSPGWTVSLP